MKSWSGLELPGHPVQDEVELGGLLGGAGDDQGRPGLVDQDGVHFVDDGVVEFALDVVLQGELHVVPKVVEAEFVVGAVGDVRGIGVTALVIVQAVDDGVHPQVQKIVNAAHPLGITFGQIIVDRDDVHALTGEGVEIGGHGGHQGLAFTGLHFSDLALVQDDAADELDVEGTQPQDPGGGLPHRGEGLGQKVVQGLLPVEALLELCGLGPEPGVGQGPVFGLQDVNGVHQGRQALELALVFTAEDFFEDKLDHRLSSLIFAPWRLGLRNIAHAKA